MTDKRIKFDCPFCGQPKDKIEIIQYGKLTRITCSKCGVMYNASSKQDAIDKWNRRV